MIISLDETITILNGWKEESTPLLVLGQNPFSRGLQAVHEQGSAIDWNLALRAKVSHVSVSEGRNPSKRGIVLFEAERGNLSLAMESGAFSYDQNCGIPEFVGEESGLRAQACLFIFLASNETFVIYALGVA